jgi:hypothetical protein
MTAFGEFARQLLVGGKAVLRERPAPAPTSPSSQLSADLLLRYLATSYRRT